MILGQAMNADSRTMEVKSSFPPVADVQTRLLVLGSLPGEVSLAQQRYYANPRNQFWALMGAVIGHDLTAMQYEERLAALQAAHVGLWDVVASGVRKGSLDTNIRAHRANDLQELVARLPRLAAVGFNGGKSAEIGRKQLAGTDRLHLLPLPSSSPAYTLSFERKREQWLRLREFL